MLKSIILKGDCRPWRCLIIVNINCISMFQNSFQSGAYFEVFDPKEVENKVNKDKALLYSKLFHKVNPSQVKRVFDNELKGFIFEIEGHATKMQFPKQGDLGLILQFLVVQVFVHPGYSWTIELDVSDTSKTKRRIVLTDSVKNLEQHFFHIKSPIDHVRRGSWLNLCIDVWSFMEAFKHCTFRSVDTIIIGSPCKLRKIYMMKNPIEDSEIDITYTQGFVSAPKQVNFPEYFPYSNQLVTFRLLNFNEFLLSEQIQNYPEEPNAKYLYDQKSQAQILSRKIGKLKYQKQEAPQKSQRQKSLEGDEDSFKRYAEKNIIEKLDSEQPSYDILNRERPSYFEDIDSQYGEEDELIDVIYDPQLNCYFDPKTGDYYQLNQ